MTIKTNFSAINVTPAGAVMLKVTFEELNAYGAYPLRAEVTVDLVDSLSKPIDQLLADARVAALDRVQEILSRTSTQPLR